jgi:hypothetical protein
MSGAMVPLPASSAMEKRFAAARERFEAGDLEAALGLFTEIARDDRWFLKAYEFLRQICDRLKTRALPNSAEWTRIVDLEGQLERSKLRCEREARARNLSVDHGEGDFSSILENLDGPAIADPSQDAVSTGRRRGRGKHSDPNQRPGTSTGRRGQKFELDGPPIHGDLPAPTPATPQAETIERNPHIDIIADGPIRPSDVFELQVYLDTVAARLGETSVKVVAASGSEVEVNIVTSEHFRVLGEPSATFRISKDDLRVDIPRFRAECVPEAEWGEGVPVIIAVFFVDGRPCGKVSRTVNVQGRPPDDVPVAGTIEIGPNGGPPADLTVTIVSDDATNDGRRFWCTVSTPHLQQYSKRVTKLWVLKDVARRLVMGYMDGFTSARKEMLVASLFGAGKQLFEASPQLFQDVLWEMIDRGVPLRTIAIVSAEPFIPWELMVPNRLVNGRIDERDKPLGVSYEIGRWTDERIIAPPRHITLVDSYVIAPVYQGGMALANSAAEAQMVLAQFPGELVNPAKFAQLQNALGGVGRSLVHFVCHGTDDDSGIQTVHLEAGDMLTSSNVGGIPNIAKVFGDKRPVVFLNACEVGRGAPALVGLGGFAASFVKLGAAAVIAPLWSVDDKIAHSIASDFYDALKQNQGIPFSRIFAQIRAKAYDQTTGEDTYAAYCFYGDPCATA